MTPATPPSVDWALAGTLGSRLARPGPRDAPTTRDERVELVASLRSAADRAAEHVVRLTGLEPADGGGLDGPHGTGLSPVRVVDRATWVRRNTRMLATMTAPVGTNTGTSTDADALLAAGLTGSVAGRTTAAAELAVVLAVLAGRVLGQFDPFAAPVLDPAVPAGRTRPGALLLVAPSVLQIERRLGADPADFRLWVALHEQTHALQAAAAPWLAGHLRAATNEILATLDDGRDDDGRGDDDGRDDDGRGEGGDASGSGPSKLVERLRDLTSADPFGGVLRPDQRAPVERISAVMALLEGHADVTMDAVGRSVVPSVHEIRRSFDQTRAHGSGPVWQRLLRRLLGLDAKLAQYAEGAAFVRAVQRKGGRTALAVAFSEPEALPTPHEITDPRAWLRRVAP